MKKRSKLLCFIPILWILNAMIKDNNNQYQLFGNIYYSDYTERFFVNNLTAYQYTIDETKIKNTKMIVDVFDDKINEENNLKYDKYYTNV